MRLPLQISRPWSVALGAVAIASAGLGATRVASAQDAPATAPPAKPLTPWHGSADLSGTILYGAANQRVFAGALGTSRIDPEYELRFDFSGGYGDSRNQDTRVRSVIARNLRFSTAFDLHPHDRTSPFVFGSAETSFQQRYRLRTSAGVGAKQTFWRRDTVIDGFAEDASVSAALLAENTELLPDAPASSKASAGSLVRYSLRVRVRKRLNKTIQFSHVTLYQPTVRDLERYTLEAVTSVSVPIIARVRFIVSHRERLDSEAVKRGAPSIRDGQIVFGVNAKF
ncbi:MAG: DUF481 domain-containing protein [Gemmatimonadaceae bacterium]